MNRLSSELHRLYLNQAPPDGVTATATTGVRAMVLELARPADWDLMGKVWQGVQVDLELPAPAIAVSGVDGYQLWFSLTAPVPVDEALGLLQALRERYLGEVATDRLRLLPVGGGANLPGAAEQAALVPARQEATGHWSAFVASDLARIFAEEPWLDLAPNPDAQADLLSRLGSITPQALRQAAQRLNPEPRPTPRADGPQAISWASGGDNPTQAPRDFLLGVMNDPGVALQWRIEAAKALLAHAGGPNAA